MFLKELWRYPAELDVTQRAQLLFHHGGRYGRILFEPFGDGGFEGIELAFTLPMGGAFRRRIQILLDGPPTHMQVPSILRIGQPSDQ